MIVLTVLLSVSIIEFGTRAILAVRVGPSVIWYGTQFERQHVQSPAPEPEATPGSIPGDSGRDNHTVAGHGFRENGYSKYWPHQHRVDNNPVTGEVFDVKINSRGFRGDDFSVEKPSNTLRVVTLGSSSTFGYFSRDDETYPVILEEYLNQNSNGDVTFEVINLGIPHACSWNVVEILKQEALGLSPDIVTLYLGANDVVRPILFGPAKTRTAREVVVDVASETYQTIRRGLVFVALVDSLVRQSGPVLETITTGKSSINGKTQANYENWRNGIPERFFGNLSEIRDICREHGIVLIVANQQLQSNTLNPQDRKGVSYEEEVNLVRSILERDGSVTDGQFYLLLHNELMQNIERWTVEEGVQFIDIIAVLDDSRDELLSWVHPSPAANRVIARAFADCILADPKFRR